MKYPSSALLAIAAAAMLVYGPAGTRHADAESPATICDDLTGENAKNCRDALELLTQETPVPERDLAIMLSRSAEGWHYRFDDSEETACADAGPVSLPKDKVVDLAIISQDDLYEWSVPALGIDVDIIPGRIASILVHPRAAGKFDGEMAGISGERIEDADGSVDVLDDAVFDAWRSEMEGRTC